VKLYSVVCRPTVEDQLAELLVRHWGTPLSEQLTSAASRIDRELAVRPMETGTQLPESPANIRNVVAYPLGVDYEVSEDDRTVTLLRYHFVQPDE
jgi:hypothetical protein